MRAVRIDGETAADWPLGIYVRCPMALAEALGLLRQASSWIDLPGGVLARMEDVALAAWAAPLARRETAR